jgi:predicted ATPase/tetratricopeptide (TPR) repeat protein
MARELGWSLAGAESPGAGGAHIAASGTTEARFREVWFVDLSTTEVAEAAIGLVADTLGVSQHDEMPEAAASRVAAALSHRGRVLVILDNLEQLDAEFFVTVTRWMAAAPATHWLCTSRHRLELAGEHVHELSPLALPAEDAPREQFSEVDSVRLFLERARAAGAEVDVSQPGVTAPLLKVIRLLDGLPLALEMAAARLRLLRLSELAERLNERFALLRSTTRPVPDRRKTLFATLTWSWELLADVERAALAQCTAFRGVFDLRAAEGVLSLPAGAPPVVEILERLRDKSLIQLDDLPEGRYLRLLLSVRDFALQAWREGASEDLDALALRHARYYSALAKPAIRPGAAGDHERTLQRLVAQRDNLLHVLKSLPGLGTSPLASRQGLGPEIAEMALWTALALDWIASTRGSPRDVSGWLEQALELAQSVAPHGVGAGRVRAEIALARVSRRLFRTARAEAALERARSLLQGDGSSEIPETEREILQGLLEVERAGLTFYVGNPTVETVRQAQGAVARLTAAGAAHDAAGARICAAMLHLARSDYDAGEAELREALATFHALAAGPAATLVQSKLAQLFVERGEMEQAAHWATEALAATGPAAVEPATSSAWELLGMARLECLDLDAAEASLDRAIAGYLRWGEPPAAAHPLVYLASLARERGQADAARAHFEQALRMGSPNSPWFRETVCEYRAEVAWDSGDLAAASDGLANALDIVASDDALRRWLCLTRLAALRAVQGERAVAHALVAEAGALRERVSSPRFRLAGDLYAACLEATDLRSAADDDARVPGLIDSLAACLAPAVRSDEPLGSSSGAGGPPVASAGAWIVRSRTVRTAYRRLLSVLPNARRLTVAARAHDPQGVAMVVGCEGAWLRTPEGQTIDTSHRPQLARLMAALVQARLDEGGRPLESQELIDRVWPGEAILPEAAANRLYYVIGALRKAGLGQALISTNEGYMLDPTLPLLRPLDFGPADVEGSS